MTNLYRVTGPEDTLRKVFGSKRNEPMSAVQIVECLEGANTDNLFWNFWDLCNGPLVGVDSFKAYPEASATANVLHTTWGEEKVLEFLGLGDDWEPDLYTTFGSVYYPNLMSIKRKDLDK